MSVSAAAGLAAPPGPVLRVGRRVHIGPCARMLQSWLDATPWMPDLHALPETERFLAERVFRENTVRVAMLAGEPAGFVAVARDGFVPVLHVAAWARGLGIGGALLGWAKEVRPRRLSLWCFVANLGARRFYAREGFEEARRTDGDNDERLPDILFVWEPSMHDLAEGAAR